MIVGGAALIAGLAIQHGLAINGSTVFGDRDIGQTACPGDHLYSRMPSLRDGTPGGNVVVDEGGCTAQKRADCGGFGCGCADGE